MTSSREVSPDVADVVEGMKKQKQKLETTAVPSNAPTQAAHSPTQSDSTLPPTVLEDDVSSDAIESDPDATESDPEDGVSPDATELVPEDDVSSDAIESDSGLPRGALTVLENEVRSNVNEWVEPPSSPPRRYTGLAQHPNQLVKPRPNQQAAATSTRSRPPINAGEDDDDKDSNQFPSPPPSSSSPIRDDSNSDEGPVDPDQWPTSYERESSRRKPTFR